MKTIFLSLLCLLIYTSGFAQVPINDEAFRYQEQRMVFQQWDQNKFKPGKGFLDLNPYYWLVWGLFYPNYHKTDLRPLSATGPQTQRLALVGTQSSTDNSYKQNSDTVRNTALSAVLFIPTQKTMAITRAMYTHRGLLRTNTAHSAVR